MQKRIGIYLLEVGVLVAILFAVSILYLNQKIISAFYNADMLYLPMLFHDLFYNSGNYVDWSLTPAPYFFPDWLIYFIAFSLTKKLYFQFLINAGLNVLLLYVAIRLIYLEFFSKIKAVLFSLASLSIFLVLAISSDLQYSQGFIYQALFLPNIHVGVFIIGIFYLWLQLKLLVNCEINKCSYFLFFAVLISFAAGISDLLYIVQFTAPVFMVYCLFFLKGKVNLEKILKFSFLPLIFSGLGGCLIKHVVHRSTLWAYLKLVSSSNFSLQSIKEDFTNYIFNFLKTISPLISLIFVIFYISIILVLLYFILKKNKYKQLSINKNVIFICSFFLFSVVINIFATGLENSGVRYIYPFFYYPVLFFFCLGSIFKNNKIIINSLSILSIVVLIICFILLINFYFKNFFKLKNDYYPNDIACLDQALANEGHDGVAQYWQSFNITMLSKEKIRVFPLKRDLTPFGFIDNIRWFDKRYSFAIIDLGQSSERLTWVLDEKLIKQNNGEPKSTVICGDKKILIYDKNSLKINKLSKPGHSFTWPANALFSRYPNSETSDGKRTVKPTDPPNYLSYGPYIVLPEGHYQFIIHYSSDAAPDKKVAFWDVLSVTAGINSVEHPIFGSNNITNEIKGTFDVVKKQANKDPFEIRIFFLGGTNFSFENLTIQKI